MFLPNLYREIQKRSHRRSIDRLDRKTAIERCLPTSDSICRISPHILASRLISFWQRVIQGMVIVLAVVYDQWRRRRFG
jgi:hypothetical protein